MLLRYANCFAVLVWSVVLPFFVALGTILLAPPVLHCRHAHYTYMFAIILVALAIAV